MKEAQMIQITINNKRQLSYIVKLISDVPQLYFDNASNKEWIPSD